MIRERLHASPLVARALEERPELQEDPVALLKHLEEKGLVEDIFASLESSLQRQPPARGTGGEAAIVAEAVAAPAAAVGAQAGTPHGSASAWQLC